LFPKYCGVLYSDNGKSPNKISDRRRVKRLTKVYMINVTEYCHYLGLKRLIRNLVWVNQKEGVLQGILREQSSVINIVNMIQ
jgi:hypothetical protein